MEVTIKKRKTYSDAEKAFLLEAYKSSNTVRKEWCKEKGIGLSTLDRWLQQEKKQIQPPIQSWIPVTTTTPQPSKTLEIQIGKCKIAVDHTIDKQLLATVLGVMVEVC